MAGLKEGAEVLYLHDAVEELNEFVQKNFSMLCFLKKVLSCCLAVISRRLLLLLLHVCLLLSQKFLIRTKKSLMVLRLILGEIVSHLLPWLLFFGELRAYIHPLLLLVLFLEVYKEDALDQVLIHPHLSVLVL